MKKWILTMLFATGFSVNSFGECNSVSQYYAFAALDISGDGLVTPLEQRRTLNAMSYYIGQRTTRIPHRYRILDVNLDGIITPMDRLITTGVGRYAIANAQRTRGGSWYCINKLRAFSLLHYHRLGSNSRMVRHRRQKRYSALVTVIRSLARDRNLDRQNVPRAALRKHRDLDFNRDGVFNSTDESILAAACSAVGCGYYRIPWIRHQ